MGDRASGCAQAEAVAALVNARTPAAADSALAGLSGGLGAAIAAMRGDALSILAELEVRTCVLAAQWSNHGLSSW